MGDLELVQGQSWHCAALTLLKGIWMGRRQQTQRLLGAGACFGADPRARREASTSGLKGFKGLVPVPTNLDQSDFFA